MRPLLKFRGFAKLPLVACMEEPGHEGWEEYYAFL